MPDDNITPFPVKRADAAPVADLLIGPFEYYAVRVEGRIIPRLTGYHDGDKIALVVDGRFSASFAPDDAKQAAWLIAEALAIGEGYPWLGATTKEQPFAPFGNAIDTAPDGESGL